MKATFALLVFPVVIVVLIIILILIFIFIFILRFISIFTGITLFKIYLHKFIVLNQHVFVFQVYYRKSRQIIIWILLKCHVIHRSINGWSCFDFKDNLPSIFITFNARIWCKIHLLDLTCQYKWIIFWVLLYMIDINRLILFMYICTFAPVKHLNNSVL